MLGGLDDYLLPLNYHKPWDLPENLRWDCVENAVRLLDAFIRAQGETA
jgi:hypothetical protein